MTSTQGTASSSFIPLLTSSIFFMKNVPVPLHFFNLLLFNPPTFIHKSSHLSKDILFFIGCSFQEQAPLGWILVSEGLEYDAKIVTI